LAQAALRSEPMSRPDRSMQPPIGVGDHVQILGWNMVGQVHYRGETKFAPGEWIGVVTDEPVGKNDGSVQGTRYFCCAPHHGLFLRPKHVTRVDASSTPQAVLPFPVLRRSASGRETLSSRQRPSLSPTQAALPGSLSSKVDPAPDAGASGSCARALQVPSQSPGSTASTGGSCAESSLASSSSRVGSPSAVDGSLADSQTKGRRTWARLALRALDRQAQVQDEERCYVQEELSRALRDGNVEEVRHCLLRVSRLGGRSQEVDAAWRILDAETERLQETRRGLEDERQGLLRRVASLEEALLAQRTVLASTATPPEGPSPEWMAAMSQIVGEAVRPVLEELHAVRALPALGIGAAAAPADLGAARRSSHRLPKLSEIRWSQRFAVPERYRCRGAHVPDTHRRGITLEQLEDLGSLIQQVLGGMDIIDPHPESSAGRITWANVNLYHINELFVLQLTRSERCSLVELIGQGVQDPRWFVSHWWGTPYRDTLSMLGFHAQSHALPATAPYWICTFANNQHNLEELDQRDLMQTPFARAIMSLTCEGTVMLMNNTAEPFRRTWCTLENYVSTTFARREKQHAQLLEVAAVIPDGQQVVHTDKGERKIPRSPALLMDDGRHNLIDKVEVKGSWFPDTVAKQGAKADIAKANASNQEDKRNILRLIIGVERPEDLPEPPASHEKYDTVNRAIHAVFAPRALYGAAQDGNLEEVRRIIVGEHLCNADQANSLGETPLWTAAFHGHANVTELLLARRANPDRANSHGATPAYAAAAKDALGALTALLQARADPNLPDDDGTTPLFWPAQHNYAEIMDLLLTARANPNSVNRQGRAPIHDAAVRGHEDALELLLEARADPTRHNGEGHLPASLATQGGFPAALEVLLEARADPNCRDRDADGSTCLSWAAYHVDAGAVRVLLAARADTNAAVGRETPLDCVHAKQTREGKQEVIETLVAAGAKRFAEL